MDPITESATGIVVSVYAKPRASRDAIVGIRGGALEVAVRAVPEAGRANGAIRAVIAATLDVPPRSVTLVAGAGARQKRFAVIGIDAATARERFGLLDQTR